tara:strand:- start:3456 stop:3899 length:444 start_codon:yes stop_codon:yes gene_type:complete
MQFDDLYFMKQALLEAEKSIEKNEVPVGAVIVVNQKIIGRGHNLIENLEDVTAHAEMQAITAASNFLNGKFLDECTLYVTLEPCTMCGGALYLARISRVVIGAMDFKRGYSSLGIKLHPKTKVSNGILAEESERLLQDFFLKRRNKK